MNAAAAIRMVESGQVEAIRAGIAVVIHAGKLSLSKACHIIDQARRRKECSVFIQLDDGLRCLEHVVIIIGHVRCSLLSIDPGDCIGESMEAVPGDAALWVTQYPGSAVFQAFERPTLIALVV